IGLFVLWCFVVSRWYVCHIKHLCGPDEPPIVAPPPSVDDRPLVFKWSDENPITRSTFDQFKKDRIDGLGKGQMLEITGYYYPGEPVPEGYANMGLARAAKIKALFIPPLSENQVVESSKLISPAPEGIQGDTLFESAAFAYKSPAPPETVECIVGTNNSLTILFPYGKSEREVDAKIEECLQDVIQLLKNTDDKAHITGHTDDAGSDAFNMGLGQRRAQHIMNILVKNGIAKTRITIESKGESQPVADNGTEEGSRQNRRAVLTIIQQ
ncbi:MAG TPA: OmpA family protein, partial [Flavobacteriia bacterium]|nr:OmpA family protein [Flavobacteriia bacterium]